MARGFFEVAASRHAAAAIPGAEYPTAHWPTTSMVCF